MLSIGNYSFEDCGLTFVDIPNSLTSIGEGAFAGCSHISSIVSHIEEPFFIYGKSKSYRAFDVETFNNAILYVPTGTIERYMTTAGWKDFINIEERDLASIVQIIEKDLHVKNNNGTITIEGSIEGEQIYVYNCSGQLLGTAIAHSKFATLNITLQSGEICIVRIGGNIVKYMMK